MAITSWSGNGGFVRKTAPVVKLFDGVTKWTLKRSAVLAETTHAGTQGRQQRKRVVKGGTFALEFVWDSTNIPDSASGMAIEPGDEVTLELNLGLSGKKYSTPVIVENFETVDDEVKDVIRGTMDGFVNGLIVLT